MLMLSVEAISLLKSPSSMSFKISFSRSERIFPELMFSKSICCPFEDSIMDEHISDPQTGV